MKRKWVNPLVTEGYTLLILAEISKHKSEILQIIWLKGIISVEFNSLFLIHPYVLSYDMKGFHININILGNSTHYCIVLRVQTNIFVWNSKCNKKHTLARGTVPFA